VATAIRTYFDHTDINLRALATYPTDEEIGEIAREASEEADSLVALLGIVPGQLHRLHGVPTVVLPSIVSLLAGLPEEDDDITSLASSDADDQSISEAQELQDLIDGEENINVSRTRAQEEQMLTLTCAALAVTADEMMNV
jgi:hypothetical protein